MKKVSHGMHIAECTEEIYFAGTGCLCIARWVGNVGISGLRTSRIFQIFDPLGRRKMLGGRSLYHIEHFIYVESQLGS